MIPCPILAYHRVAPRDGSPGDAFTIAPDIFAEQMERLADRGGVGIDLDTFVDGKRLDDGRRPVVLTFDDGFADNRQHAWPILSRFGFRATTFIVTGQLGGRNDWDGPSVPRYPLLGATDCAAGAAPMMTFHSHSVSHRRFSLLDRATVARELSESRAALAEVTGRPVDLFAYPFGSVTAAAALAVRAAGYRAACTCFPSVAAPAGNPLLLRRATVGQNDTGDRFNALVEGRRTSGLMQTYKTRVREQLLALMTR